jgi:hypothetical protein
MQIYSVLMILLNKCGFLGEVKDLNLCDLAWGTFTLTLELLFISLTVRAGTISRFLTE